MSVAAVSELAAFALLAALNLGFEEWGEGRAIGWTRGDGGRLTSECDDAFEGRCAAKLIRDARAAGASTTIFQQVPAYEARGQTVRLSGWIRTVDLRGMAGLWVRVERDGRELASSHNLISARSGSTEWQSLELDVYVDAAAERIVLGLMLAGRGVAFFDDLSLVVH